MTISFDKCIASIQKAAGRKLSDEELDTLLEGLQKKIRAKTASFFPDPAGAAAEELAEEIALAVKIERRNAALNVRARLDAVEFVRSEFPNDPALGLESLLVGVNRSRLGSRFSVAATQQALMGDYLGGFFADMEREKLTSVLNSGALDREIAQALWKLGDESLPFGQTSDLRGLDIPAEAEAIGRIIHKWQEKARLDANRSGAAIGRLGGYIVRQSHDQRKILKAGRDAWKTAVRERIDWQRTLPDAEDVHIEAFLDKVYENLASGVHIKAQRSPTSVEGGDPASGFKGSRNIAKGLSQERVLHFKSADDWFDYNAQFGRGSLREAFVDGLERVARSTGMMQVLGPNAEANFGLGPRGSAPQDWTVAGQILKGLEGEPEAKLKLSNAQSWLTNRFQEVDGTTRIPGNVTAANINAMVRAGQSMAKLGGATLSAFGDLPLFASELSYQGGGFLDGIGVAFKGLLEGKAKGERLEILSSLGVVYDAARGEVRSRFSAHDDLPGGWSRLLQKFFKLNLLQWWTDTLTGAAALSMSHRLALNRSVAWGALDPDLTRTLSLYGLNEARWNVVRKAATRQEDGRHYVIPDGIEDLGDELFERVLAFEGRPATAAAIARLKREIPTQLRAYFIERSEFAVIRPDARTLATMRRGTRPGTVEGELLRHVGLFKGFSFSVVQKAGGREIFGRGADTFGQAIRNGNGEMTGLARMVAMTTLFGYGAMTAKELLKGRTPRDPRDPETWFAAMAQGGGAGIYGDFLFGEMRNRFGGGVLTTAAGPVLGGVQDIFDLVGRIREGDDPSAAAFRLALTNTPFANLFYVKPAFDYLIGYQISEALSPGYLRRLENRVERENGQTFIIPPSEFAQ